MKITPMLSSFLAVFGTAIAADQNTTLQPVSAFLELDVDQNIPLKYNGTGAPPIVGTDKDTMGNHCSGTISTASQLIVQMNGTGSGYSGGNITYYFAVTGTRDPSVPLIVSGNTATSLGPKIAPESSADVQADIYDIVGATPPVIFANCLPAPCTGQNYVPIGNGYFSGTTSVMGEHTIGVEYGGVAYPDFDPPNGYSASVTGNGLYIQIDPTYQSQHPNVGLKFSPGIKNVPVNPGQW